MYKDLYFAFYLYKLVLLSKDTTLGTNKRRGKWEEKKARGGGGVRADKTTTL